MLAGTILALVMNYTRRYIYFKLKILLSYHLKKRWKATLICFEPLVNIFVMISLLSVVLFYYQETFSSTERPVLDVHRRKSYYIVPQNKLGQDIYIRTTENSSSLVTLLPSGDDRSIKVPASKDLLDSHLNGKSAKSYLLMITAILADAEVALFYCTQLCTFDLLVESSASSAASAYCLPVMKCCGQLFDLLSQLALLSWFVIAHTELP